MLTTMVQEASLMGLDSVFLQNDSCWSCHGSRLQTAFRGDLHQIEWECLWWVSLMVTQQDTSEAVIVNPQVHYIHSLKM